MTIRFLALALLIPALLACGPAEPAPIDDSSPIRVVVTVPDVGHWVQMIGGDLVEVDPLIPSGASPHHWQPSASDLRTLADADLAVIVGDVMEPWAERFLTATRSGRANVAILDLIPEDRLRHFGERGAHGHSDGHDDGGEDMSDIDPHVWLSPSLAMIAARGLADQLQTLRPNQMESLEQHWQSAQGEFQSLIDECAQCGARWRETNGDRPPSIIPLHGAWGYLADEVGIEISEIIEVTPGIEPSPTALRALVDHVREHGVRAIVAEPQLNPALANRLAEMTGASVVTLDPLGSGAASYGEHIRGILDALDPMMTAP